MPKTDREKHLDNVRASMTRGDHNTVTDHPPTAVSKEALKEPVREYEPLVERALTGHLRAPASGGLSCAGCSVPYGSEAWIEAVVPDKDWASISPTGDEGGTLCINCMAKAFAQLGRTGVPVKLTAGPFVIDGTPASREAREIVAWLHTLHMEGGQTHERLSRDDGKDPDYPSRTAFGIPGRDYSAEYPVTSEPLFTRLSTDTEAMQLLREALERIAETHGIKAAQSCRSIARAALCDGGGG